MTVRSQVNQTNMQSSLVAIDNLEAVKIVDANSSRLKLSIELPCDLLNYCVAISESEAQADLLLGEMISQDFSANNNRVLAKIIFDTNSDSQGEKWALMTTALTFETSATLNVVEYIG